MKKTLLLLLAVGAIVLASCSSDSDSDADTGGPYGSSDETEQADGGATADAGGSGSIVTTGTTDLGEVLVDGDGLSLYGFTPDLDEGAPTCVDACADAWPPIFVDGDELPEGLDGSVFSVVEHPSGQNQLQAGDAPLYLFAGDAEPGDTNGQGSGDTWFLVAPDGSLIE
jgi:predicted lipoprotein with Yx(FWY)xxD motif